MKIQRKTEPSIEERNLELVKAGLNPIPWRKRDKVIVRIILLFAFLNLTVSLIIFMVIEGII